MASLYPPLNTVVQCLQNGQVAKAEQLCHGICNAYPNYADALQLLAIIYAQIGQFESAQGYFERAITTAPQRLDFHGNYANLLYERGNYAEAIAHGQIALRQKPVQPEVYNTLGNALYRQSQYQEALTHYQQALALQPDYAEGYNNLGQALRALHDYSAAEACFQQALKLQPDFAAAAANLQAVNPRWLAPLVGSRVRVRRQTVQDADFLWRCFQGTSFMHLYNRFLPVDFSLDMLKEQLAKQATGHPLETRSINWLIERCDTQRNWQSIGVASLTDIQAYHRRAELKIGIPAAKNLPGVGLTVALMIMDFFFNQIKFHRLVSMVYGDNQASLHNTQVLGLVREGHLREHLWHAPSGTYVDLYTYGLLVQEFRANRRLARLAQRLLGRDITQITGVS